MYRLFICLVSKYYSPKVNSTTLFYLGVTVGAGCSLSVLKDVLLQGIEELGTEKSRVYQALVQTLQCLAGKQIRNMAVSIKNKSL